jgi:hypothetical protein
LAQKISGPAPGWEQLQLGNIKKLIASKVSEIAPKEPGSDHLTNQFETADIFGKEIDAFLGKRATQMSGFLS